MNNLIGAVASSYILPGILLLLVIGLLVINSYRNKKYQENARDMINNLKKGDRVKTYSGFFGTIVEIKDTENGREVTLETGSSKGKSYITLDINAIYGLAMESIKKEEAKGEEITPKQEKSKQKVVNDSEVKLDESGIEKKKTAKKPAAKKSTTAKKTTTKKSPAKKSTTSKKTAK